MKKIVISLVAVIGFGFVANAQTNSDLKIAKLKGKVKSVREITYDREGQKVDGRDGKFDDKPWSELPLAHPVSSAAIYPFKNSMINYDENGSITEIVVYSENDEINSRYTYKYDANGKKLERIQYSDGTLYNKFVFNYDATGKFVSMKCGYPETEIYCTALPDKSDAKGNITVFKLNYTDESIDITCKYDNNNVTSISIGGEEVEIKYDSENRIIKDIVGEYSYDNNGNLIQNGTDEDTFLIIYTNHDANGNWTKAIEGDGIETVERVITYW